MTKAKPGSTYPPRGKTTVEERFWMKVDRSGDCWLWTAGKNGSGYGTFNPTHNGGAVGAHRYAYELLMGPIPPGMEPDHLCKTRLCVNAPAHMALRTKQANNARSNSPTGINSRKTRCSRGHEFTPENTYTYRNMRSCRQCRAMHSANAKARKQMH